MRNKIIMGMLIAAIGSSSFLLVDTANASKKGDEVIEAEYKLDRAKEKVHIEKLQNNIKIKEIILQEYYETKEDSDKYKEKNQNIILHNEGKEIKTNILAERNGYKLIAVHKYIGNNYDFAEYYYSQETENDIETVKSNLDFKEIERLNKIENVPKTYYRNSHWIYKHSNENYYTINDEMSLKRESKNSDFNGESASIWNISLESKIKGTVSTARIKNQITELSNEAFVNQSIVDYGDVSNEKLKVSYNVGKGKWTVKDLSSMAHDYGKWKFIAPVFSHLKNLETITEARFVNTQGNLGIETSHIHNTKQEEYKTGVVQYFIEDRELTKIKDK